MKAYERQAIGALIELVDAVLKSRKLAILALHPYDRDAIRPSRRVASQWRSGKSRICRTAEFECEASGRPRDPKGQEGRNWDESVHDALTIRRARLEILLSAERALSQRASLSILAVLAATVLKLRPAWRSARLSELRRAG